MRKIRLSEKVNIYIVFYCSNTEVMSFSLTVNVYGARMFVCSCAGEDFVTG